MLFSRTHLPAFCFLIAIVFQSCQPRSANEKEGFDLLRSMDQPSLELDGKTLAEMYCQACHLFPDPSLLDQATWENGVLPDMRRRLGLITEEDFGVAVGEDNDAPPGIYASSPLITSDIWEKIRAYYRENAPAQLPKNNHWENEVTDSELFEMVVPDFPNKRPSLTTLLRYNPFDKKIYLGDRLRSLSRFDPYTFKVLDSVMVSSPPSEIAFGADGFHLLTMGVMDPSNFSTGKFSFFDYGFQEQVILQNLTRPVHFANADLLGDGSESWLVSAFGNHLGQLSYFRKVGDSYQEHKLNALPGARRTVVRDVNGDGLQDVVAMMTQAREGIYAYINQGGGKFLEEKWLTFHPVFGSSDFEWIDMNGDGFADLVVVNGDNADLSPIEKPYHGVRVFLNDGLMHFSEEYFFPMNGASGLTVGDFDGNGRTDIAAISYFPQVSNGEWRNFVLLMQDSLGKYNPASVPGLGSLNYLVIDKADIDQDGDLDLMLGSFDFKSTYASPSWTWTPFVILKNKSQNK